MSHLTCQGGTDFDKRDHLREDRTTLCPECMAEPAQPCLVCGALFGPEGDADLEVCMGCSDRMHQQGAS